MNKPSKNNIFWYLLLKPFSMIYGLIAYIRNLFFDFHLLRSVEFDVPVISVGNITVGGTGKTPFIEFLVSILEKEFKVAILSRGYKRKSKGFLLADTHSTLDDLGDEPLQMKKKFPEVTLAVDKNRVHGIKELLERDNSLDVILLDDAYQHRYVKPGLSILMIDFNQPLSKDHYLPLGRLRESPSEKTRAHIVVTTKCPENLKPIEQRIILNEMNLYPYQKLFFTTIKYGKIKPVFSDSPASLTKDDCKTGKYSILLVTGIANSRPLRKHTRSISPKLKEIKFPDHHNFTIKDMKHIGETFRNIENEKKIIITTEKDAMRLGSFEGDILPDKEYWYYIPIEVSFHNRAKTSFVNYIVDYVKKNRRNNLLS
jgi:tetraacyldisaccharide 4'-kinase